jgi:hypothetical protein
MMKASNKKMTNKMMTMTDDKAYDNEDNEDPDEDIEDDQYD